MADLPGSAALSALQGVAKDTTLTGGSQVTGLVQPDKTPIIIPVTAPVIPSNADGSPVNGGWVSSGPGAVIDSILWSLNTSQAQSVAFFFTAYGSGWNFQTEITYDGVNWKNVPHVRADAVNTYTIGAGSPSGNTFIMDTLGAIATRARVTTAGTGDAPISFARTIVFPIAFTMAMQRSTSHVITPTTVIGGTYGVDVSSRAVYIQGWRFHNLTSTDIFISISARTSSAQPWTSAALEYERIRVKAGGDLSETYLGKGLAVSAFAYKAFADAALTTPAVTGTLIGSIKFGA